MLSAQSKVVVDYVGNNASMARDVDLIAMQDAWEIALEMLVAELA